MTNPTETNPELAARHTMADALLGDFEDAVEAYKERGAKPPDYATWAQRLASALSELLYAIDGEPSTGAGVPRPGGGWVSGSMRPGPAT